MGMKLDVVGNLICIRSYFSEELQTKLTLPAVICNCSTRMSLQSYGLMGQGKMKAQQKQYTTETSF